jgi:hypothetical protein
MIILQTLLKYCFEVFYDHQQDLLGVFTSALSSNSLNVKHETIKAISSYVTYADEKHVAPFKSLLIKMYEACYFIVGNN